MRPGKRGSTAWLNDGYRAPGSPYTRVLQYLTAEFERPELTAGSRLPTVRQLSSQLHVSVPTVHKVFRELTREGRIRSEVGRGTFLVSPRSKEMRRITVALGIRTPEGQPSDQWFSRIYAGILKAATRSERPMALSPLPHGAWKDGDSLRRTLLGEMPEVTGLISFPFKPFVPEVIASYERAGKPVVHLNPPAETATANFVSPDYYGASLQLGRAWRETGRRRVLLLIGGPLADTVSGRLRLSGLVNGLGDAVAIRIADGVSSDLRGGAAAARHFLGIGGWIPDAVYCDGDFMALGTVQALREKGLSVPGDVSVVGGSGMEFRDPTCPSLTTTGQPHEQLGEDLVRMLCELLRVQRHGIATVAGQVLPTPFLGGGSTRPEENKILGIVG